MSVKMRSRHKRSRVYTGDAQSFMNSRDAVSRRRIGIPPICGRGHWWTLSTTKARADISQAAIPIFIGSLYRDQSICRPIRRLVGLLVAPKPSQPTAPTPTHTIPSYLFRKKKEKQVFLYNHGVCSMSRAPPAILALQKWTFLCSQMVTHNATRRRDTLAPPFRLINVTRDQLVDK